MKKVSKIIALGFFISLTACQGLDPLLYNPDTSISEYKFESFDGEQEINVDQIQIHDSMINLLPLDHPNGERMYSVFIGDSSRIGTDTIIVYCHGNAGHMDFYWSRAKLLAAAGGLHNYGVLMMDYRGFGLSEGEPNESNMYEDVDLCLQWLQNRGLSNDRFMIYGFSLGSAPACELTSKPRSLQASKIILENPFASDEVMAEDNSGLSLPGSFFSNLEIDNAEEIKNINQPFMHLHSRNDNFLRYETHGKKVWLNYNGSYSEQHLIDGADHADYPKVMGYSRYMQVINDFITRP